MRSPKLFFILLLSNLLFLAPGLCFSQVAQQWVRTYNSPENGSDAPTAMVVDGNGNTYVSGRSVDAETGTVYATIKYDAAGNKRWVKTISGANEFGGTAMAVDASGNVYVTGSVSGNATGFDFATIKCDTN